MRKESRLGPGEVFAGRVVRVEALADAVTECKHGLLEAIGNTPSWAKLGNNMRVLRALVRVDASSAEGLPPEIEL